MARNPALAFELHDGVERVARGLAADAAPKLIADHPQGESERENLRDALDRERRFAVAPCCRVSLGIDDGDAEGARVDPGDVGGRLAAIRPPHLVGNLLDDEIESRGISHGGTGCGAGRAVF